MPKTSTFLPKSRIVTVKDMAVATLKSRGDDVTADSIARTSKSVRAKIRRHNGGTNGGNRYAGFPRKTAATILDGKESK